MTTLKVIDREYDGDMKFPEYNFELSNFQKNAIDSFVNGCNVFIAAPTGSGKTLPAEYALMHAVKSGKKAIYTSPIKTLSNQKFKEFTENFPEADVGIITGDIKYNPTGNILIMTTEILRNLLFNKKIQDIQNRIEIEIDIARDFSLVVFDEVHYINDIDRGRVWEESIILLPDSVQMMLLSATIDNPIEFCEWIRSIKNRNIVLSSTKRRIVPLKHCIYTHYLDSYMKKTKQHAQCSKYNNKLTIFSDENNSLLNDTYQDCTHHLKSTHGGLSRSHVYQEVIHYLTKNNLTPCIFFCFSRKKCEKLAKTISHSLLDHAEISEMKKIVEFNLRKCDQYESYVKLDQYSNLMKCLEKGIAFHHSGLLPIFKEIVEILYGKYLVKVLFATETFAVGVNMPTKTVIFTSLEKYTSNMKRLLYSHEYLQMGGRAGRRGIDDVGYVILLANTQELPSISQIDNLINGHSQKIQSKFTPDYKLILKVILDNITIGSILDNSLLHTEISKEVVLLKDRLEDVNIPDIDFSICHEYDNLVYPKTDGFIKLKNSVIKKNKKLANTIKHSGGFSALYEIYKSHKDDIEKQKSLHKDIHSNSTYIGSQIKGVTTILQQQGYISDVDKITPEIVTTKGIIASEINECNEIILTELIYSNLLDNIDYKDLGAILSIFCDSKPIQTDESKYTDAYIPYQYNTYIENVNTTIKCFSNLEHYSSIYTNSVWEVNTYIMDLVYKWLAGSGFELLTLEYGLFEGNLIKDFIKIYNISAEVEKIAEILNKTNLQVESAKLRENMVRDVVNIESLYIK